jgi:hypothetical protein
MSSSDLGITIRGKELKVEIVGWKMSSLGLQV